MGTFGFAALRVARPHRDEKPVARESQTLSAVADTVAFLRAVTPFRQLDDDGLFTLAGRMRQEMIPAGGTLVREGEWGSTMFVIREGTLIISKAVSGNVEKVLVHMKQGEFLGEMSLFSRRRRSASVRAFTNAVVLILYRDGLIDLFERRPRSALRILMAIVEEFSNRLSNTDDMVAEVTRWGFEATGLSVELDD